MDLYYMTRSSVLCFASHKRKIEEVLGPPCRTITLVGAALLLLGCGKSGIGQVSWDLPAVSQDIKVSGQPSPATAIVDTLRSSDLAPAAQRIARLNCISEDPQLLDGLRASWETRDSAPRESAVRDPLVQILLAKCLIDGSRMHTASADLVMSAAETLRRGMRSSDPKIVIYALLGISGVATMDDVQEVRSLGLTQTLFAIPAITSLSAMCIPDAHTAIAELQSAYIGTATGRDINVFLEGKRQAGEPIACGGGPGNTNSEGNKEYTPTSGQVSAHEMMRPFTAEEVRHELESPDPQPATARLRMLHCHAGDSDLVGVVRSAWASRNAVSAPANIRDTSVQTVMARCLMEAGHSLAGSDPEISAALELLRTELESNDVMTIVVAMDGLMNSPVSDDLIRVAHVAKKYPKLRSTVARDLSLTCTPGATAALSEVREGADTNAEREMIDATYAQFNSERNRLCHVHN